MCDTEDTGMETDEVGMCIDEDDKQTVTASTLLCSASKDKEVELCPQENIEQNPVPGPALVSNVHSTNTFAQNGEDSGVSLQVGMLDYVAHSTKAYFKSQQLGEPELNYDQKRAIASEILTTNPGNFLARFGKHLLPEHLEHFKNLLKTKDDYEVTFYLRQLTRFYNKPKRSLDVRNRRYEALKRLNAEGSYFKEEEMKKRNPLLYEELVGKHMTTREMELQEKQTETENVTLVEVLMNQIENNEVDDLFESQVAAEMKAKEELNLSDEESPNNYLSENDDDSSSEEYHNLVKRRKRKEKVMLKEEFFSFMYDSFLEGRDKDFDYSKVDDNSEFDNITDEARDEEEKYFDSELPETSVENECGGNGEEDELETFMKNLKPDTTTDELSDHFGQIVPFISLYIS